MKDVNLMIRLCRQQSGECMLASNRSMYEEEARILKNIAQSWMRLMGQIERYKSLMVKT